MKVCILRLMAVLWVAVALHDHYVMANTDHDIYPHMKPNPIFEINASNESVFIVGLNNLCLEVNRFAPKLVTCNKTTAEQRWKFLEDGTIRPESQPLKCLTANELNNRGVIVVIQCSFSSIAYTAWTYRPSDNTIVNAHAASDNLVLDLSQSILGPQAQIFILYPNFGTDNQKWYLTDEPGRSRELSSL